MRALQINQVCTHGKIVEEEILIKARKIPLRDLRERLLRKQHKYSATKHESKTF